MDAQTLAHAKRARRRYWLSSGVFLVGFGIIRGVVVAIFSGTDDGLFDATLFGLAIFAGASLPILFGSLSRWAKPPAPEESRRWMLGWAIIGGLGMAVLMGVLGLLFWLPPSVPASARQPAALTLGLAEGAWLAAWLLADTWIQ